MKFQVGPSEAGHVVIRSDGRMPAGQAPTVRFFQRDQPEGSEPRSLEIVDGIATFGEYGHPGGRVRLIKGNHWEERCNAGNIQISAGRKWFAKQNRVEIACPPGTDVDVAGLGPMTTMIIGDFGDIAVSGTASGLINTCATKKDATLTVTDVQALQYVPHFDSLGDLDSGHTTVAIDRVDNVVLRWPMVHDVPKVNIHIGKARFVDADLWLATLVIDEPIKYGRLVMGWESFAELNGAESLYSLNWRGDAVTLNSSYGDVIDEGLHPEAVIARHYRPVWNEGEDLVTFFVNEVEQTQYGDPYEEAFRGIRENVKLAAQQSPVWAPSTTRRIDPNGLSI